MGKKKKTRREKIILDLKRKLTQSQSVVEIPPDTHPKTYSLPKETIQPPAHSAINPSKSYALVFPYVFSDIKKTMITTSILVSFELILFFLTQKNILHIPGIPR